MSEREKVRIRGLGSLASWLLGVWGAAAALKGLRDLLGGEPEANLYAPQPWAFVSREAWLRYAVFELAYGLACLGLGLALWRWSRRLPDWVERKVRGEVFP